MLGSRCKIFDMYWDMIGKLEYMGAWTGVIIGLEWLSMISPCTLTMEHLRSYCIPIDGVKWIHGYVSNCKGNIMGHHRSCFFWGDSRLFCRDRMVWQFAPTWAWQPHDRWWGDLQSFSETVFHKSSVDIWKQAKLCFWNFLFQRAGAFHNGGMSEYHIIP